MFSVKSKKRLKIFALVAFISTGAAVSYSFKDDFFEISRNIDIFVSLYRELDMYYVDEIKHGEVMKKGIDDMLESLDPYTNYIPESEIEDYRFMTTGQYGGIGAMIGQKGDYVVVTDPYEGFPAQKSDLRAGDVILEIDGKSIKGKKTDDISKILKGQPDTQVKMLIRRPGVDNPMEKTITRAEIKINSVPYFGMLDNEVGYIRLTGFTENAGQEVKDALLELKNKSGAKSIVLDLRGNPGGLLNEAVNITNLFVDRGVEVVTTKGKVKEWDKSYKALNAPVDTQIPLVVLVNSGSASASEIVSGSIQDLDRGIVIGQRTFGKGLVQTTRQLSYNAQLKVTTAKYYIPSGRCIQALDYSHRNEDGSVGKVPDSLVTLFKTKKGRTVADGGGVMPDFETENEKLSSISQSLITKQLVFDYATHYRAKNPQIAPAKDFRISEADYKDFTTWLSDKEYDYVTKSEKALEELKESAKKEDYYDGLKDQLDALKKAMMHDKLEDLDRNKEEIKELLQDEIASRYYFQKGRIESAFSFDKDIRKAIEALRNKSVFDQIMSKGPDLNNKK
ncbi:MAG: S41 family peptidase [Bacteroidota bacterium]